MHGQILIIILVYCFCSGIILAGSVCSHSLPRAKHNQVMMLLSLTRIKSTTGCSASLQETGYDLRPTFNFWGWDVVTNSQLFQSLDSLAQFLSGDEITQTAPSRYSDIKAKYQNAIYKSLQQTAHWCRRSQSRPPRRNQFIENGYRFGSTRVTDSRR